LTNLATISVSGRTLLHEIEAIFSTLSIFGHNYIHKSSHHLKLTITIFINPDLIKM